MPILPVVVEIAVARGVPGEADVQAIANERPSWKMAHVATVPSDRLPAIHALVVVALEDLFP